MDIVVGDVFSLKASAFDLKNPDKIIYASGTLATVEKIEEERIYLRFPDGAIEAEDVATILVFFNRFRDGAVILTHQTTEYGTPGRNLAKYLPPPTDWRKNYRIKVTLELEDRGFKPFMCMKCLTDLGNTPNLTEDGLTHCATCNTLVLPVNPLGDKDDQSAEAYKSSELGFTT